MRRNSAPSARVAQQVTSALTSLFIEENLRSREQQSEQTTAFLQDQLKDAGEKLAEDDRKLREFKTQYLGQLPEQLQSNLQILSGLQSRLQSTTDDMNRAQQQRLYLQSLLTEYKAVARPTTTAEGTPVPAGDDKLDKMRAQLAEYLQKYTPEHPDVIRLKKEIAALEAQDSATAQQQKGGEAAPAPRPASGIDTVAQIESQLRANQFEITNRQAELKKIQGDIDQYQARLNLTPMREQQLASLTRDYEQQKANYDSLLAKKLQSETATSLEKRQEGEQFRMIDPPSLPQKPYWPNRFMLCLAGIAIGLALAAGLVIGLELLDPKVNNKQELAIAMPAVPVLANIPQLVTVDEQRKMTRRLVAEAIAAGIVL